MKEIEFEQTNLKGNIKGVMRIIGKLVYLQVNNQEQLNQITFQLEKKGAKIIQGRGWVQIDMFNNNQFVKINNKEFDVNETTDEEVEGILFEFFMKQYVQMGFKCKSTPQ